MRIVFLATLLIAGTFGMISSAQSPANSPKTSSAEDLYQTISKLDKELFDAVDRCDMKKFDSFWADDVEFYHDKGGLMIGRQNVVEAAKNNLCGKVKRELVLGTLEVYPMNGYGAVEIGTHRFLHPWAQDHGVVGEAKFIHLWRYKDGEWKITRVISYDHGLAK